MLGLAVCFNFDTQNISERLEDLENTYSPNFDPLDINLCQLTSTVMTVAGTKRTHIIFTWPTPAVVTSLYYNNLEPNFNQQHKIEINEYFKIRLETHRNNISCHIFGSGKFFILLSQECSIHL